MSKVHNNQVKAGSGFTIPGEYPIDDRTVVQSSKVNNSTGKTNDLKGLVDNHLAYEGMQVYVIDDQKTYEYKKVSGTLSWVALSYDGHTHTYNNQKIKVLGANDSVTTDDTSFGANVEIGLKAGANITLEAANDNITITNAGVRSITQDSSDDHILNINTGGTTSTITIPDNDTKVTSADNHYDPEDETITQQAASADQDTNIGDAVWNITELVAGVNISKDSRGHVTNIAVSSIKMPENPNTHYTSKNVVGSSNTATQDGAVTGTDGVYLNHLEESTIKSSHKIVGSGGTTVTSDESGNITIHSQNTSDNNSAHIHEAGTGLAVVDNDITDGTGGISGTVTYKAKLKSDTNLTFDAADNSADNVYPIAVDKSGDLAVKVPWKDTWQQNTVDQNGYVLAPSSSNKNKVWKTDNDGNPGWREDTNTWPAVTDNSPTLNWSQTYTIGTVGSTALTVTMPTAPGNGTLTIQHNSATLGTFTANQSTDSTINITVPTKTSDLNNDSGFITQVPYGNSTPCAPMVGGDPGKSADVSRADHSHLPQSIVMVDTSKPYFLKTSTDTSYKGESGSITFII